MWAFSGAVPADRFWADPHVVERDGRYWVFLEEWIYATQKGHIAVLEIAEGDFGLVDNGTANRVYKANKRIVCQMTIKNGKVVWDKNGKSRDDWSTTPPTNPALA